MDIKNSIPLVSIIMPAYNAAPFIEEAINSVISQTVTDWELFVIDDCSKDETYQIAQRFAVNDSRITVLQNEVNSGVARTRNRAISCAEGQYLAFIDSDDVWNPRKLELQLNKLQLTGAGICYCSYRIVDVSGQSVKADYYVPETVGYEGLLKENCIQCSAMLIKTDIVKKFMFNTEFYHEDYILGLDMLRSGESAVGCKELLLDWRYIENSRSFNKKRSTINRWKIYRDYLNLPLHKTIYVFLNYVIAGVRKYK